MNRILCKLLKINKNANNETKMYSEWEQLIYPMWKGKNQKYLRYNWKNWNKPEVHEIWPIGAELNHAQIKLFFAVEFIAALLQH